MTQNSFNGFSPGKPHTVAIHAQFFSEVLPLVDDLAELKVVLFCYWALRQKTGTYRYLCYDDFIQNPDLMRGLTAVDEDPDVILVTALKKALAHNILLSTEVRLESGKQTLYFVNTPRGRTAIRQIEVGQWNPGASQPIEILPERPNIFTLYEENIGPLTPGIAERLKVAEDEYEYEWIIDAINLAIDNNVRRWVYISAILERWQQEGRADGADETLQRSGKGDSQFAGLTWSDFAD